MRITMESDKWLKTGTTGMIHINFMYKSENGESKLFNRSLKTRNKIDARRLRDTIYLPIYNSITHARLQLEAAMTLYPELEKDLYGKRVGIDGMDNEKYQLDTLAKKWSKELQKKGGNYYKSGTTPERYISVLNSFINFMQGKTNVNSITSTDIVKYRDNQLAEKVSKTKIKSASTVQLNLTVLRGFFDYLLEYGYVQKNPAKEIKVNMTKANKNRAKTSTKRRAATLNEVSTACSNIHSHIRYSSEIFQDFGMFLRYTGMRRDEILSLNVNDFNFYKKSEYTESIIANSKNYKKQYSKYKNLLSDSCYQLCAYIKGEFCKTGEDRIVPIADKLLPIFERRFNNKCKSGGLFDVENPRNFGKEWLRKIKLIANDLTIHGFRHYFISAIDNNHMIANYLSDEIVGHTKDSRNAHSAYQHSTIDALYNAVSVVE